MTYLKVDNKFVYLPGGQMLGIPPPPPPPLFSFITNSYTDSSITPNIVTTMGLLDWDFGDGESSIGVNKPTHTYSIPGNKTVKVYKGTTEGIENITHAYLINCSIVEEIDLQPLTNIQFLNLSNNKNLNSVLFPDTSTLKLIDMSSVNSLTDTSINLSKFLNLQLFSLTSDNLLNISNIVNPSTADNAYTSHYYISNTGITTLDLSGISNFGGPVAPGPVIQGLTVSIEPNLTTFIPPKNCVLAISSNTTARFNDTNLTELDLSKFRYLTYSLTVQNNPNLSSLLLPSSATNTHIIFGISSNKLTTLDVSLLKVRSFSVSNEPYLSSIIFPTNSTEATSFSLGYCPSIMGIVDLTSFSGGFRSQVYINNNENLAGIKFPDSVPGGNITDIRVYNNSNLSGTFDVSNLVLPTSFSLYNNPNITSIIFPESHQISTLNIYGNNLQGNLDVSDFTNLTYISAHSNKQLTNVMLPSTTVNTLSLYNCDLTGTFDLSNISFVSSPTINIQLNSNPNLEYIIFPNSSEWCTIYANSCDLKEFDVTNLIGIRGNVQFQDNPNLTDVYLPVFSSSFTNFFAQNCSLNSTSIEHILERLDTYYTSTPPTSNLYLYLQGGNNAKPVDGTSNMHILNLQSIFSTAGRSLILNYNK